jgi:hypothetical protein
MRLYTADLSRKFRGEAIAHWLVAVGLTAGYFLDQLLRVSAVVAFWHLHHAWIARKRAQACAKSDSGYVDISPGIQVVTLRDDRDRSAEPEVTLRN